MTKKELMYERIRKHGEDLKAIFNLDDDPVKLCKRLHIIENQAHKAAEDYCNGKLETADWEAISDKFLVKVNKILNNKTVPIFINGDSRGYALKIEDEYVRAHNLTIHKDWGGYGIIAPDFDGER